MQKLSPNSGSEKKNLAQISTILHPKQHSYIHFSDPLRKISTFNLMRN